MFRIRPTLAALLCVSILTALGCEAERTDDRPATVVEDFVDRMRGVHGDPERGRLAIELIWKKGYQALEERARRAGDVSGRRMKPEEMLVPSQFALNFKPVNYAAQIKGKWARVTVTGADPSTELAEVRCVKEDGRWRVVLDLPPLPPIERREAE